jgi:hypothetical protein
MLQFTDQPIRYCAFFIFGPILIFKGMVIEDVFILLFGILLMCVDGFCIIFKEPARLVLPVNIDLGVNMIV